MACTPGGGREQVEMAAHTADMEMLVRTSSGETLSLDVEGSDTIRSVKAKVEKAHGTPASQQRLIFAGWPLEDSRTLAELTDIKFKPPVIPCRVELRLELCRSDPDVGVHLDAERAQREVSGADGAQSEDMNRNLEPEPKPEPRAKHAVKGHRKNEKRRRLASLSVEHEQTLEREKKEGEAHLLASADKPLPAGTKIAVAGHGIGAYVDCVERWVGANDHNIDFGVGPAVAVQLKSVKWTVFESEMDALTSPEPEPEPEVEPEPELQALPEGSPPKSKDPNRKKKKRDKKRKKQKSQATNQASSNQALAPPPPPPPPPLAPPPPTLSNARDRTREGGEGNRGDLLAAIQNGGIGILKNTADTQPSIGRVGSTKTRESQYGPPWTKNPPPGLDIIGEM